MEKAGLLDRALTPLHWLERSRGWKRLGLIVLYLSIALVVGVFGWRELSLWRLPNIDEPFDTVKFGTIPVADGDNAMVVYREAARRFINPSSSYHVPSTTAWGVTDWNTADPEVLRWVADNRAGFEIWLRGTERPDSLVVQPRDMEITTILAPLQSMRSFAKIALLEGSRLEYAGDLEGAWKIYRAVLRSSRHAGKHGGLVQRMTGQSILLNARASIQVWITHPKVTPAMLRRAISDLEESAAMTSPMSEMVRSEYFASRSILSQPGKWKKWGLDGSDDDEFWYRQFSFVRPTERFFQYEPERSLRVLRLITAGFLAQCDRPAADRPQLFSSQHLVYDLDARTPPAVASISPKELVAWADKSSLRMLTFPGTRAILRIQVEPGIFDALRLATAERAFEIEHGKLPATYQDLIGDYLKALPEGIEPGEAVSAPVVPNSMGSAKQ
jgi:hypothetical protein